MNELLTVRRKICGLHRLMLRILGEIEQLRLNYPATIPQINDKEMELEYAIILLHQQIMNSVFWVENAPYSIEILGDEDYCMVDEVSNCWDRHHS